LNGRTQSRWSWRLAQSAPVAVREPSRPERQKKEKSCFKPKHSEGEPRGKESEEWGPSFLEKKKKKSVVVVPEKIAISRQKIREGLCEPRRQKGGKTVKQFSEEKRLRNTLKRFLYSLLQDKVGEKNTLS